MAINNNINIIVSAVDKTTAPLKKMGGQFSSFAQKMERSVGGLIEPLKQVGIGLLGVGGYGLKLAGDLEQTRVSFETMLGSADEAKKLLGQLSDFAATTPFEFPEIANAGKSLLAFGFEAEKIEENLRMLGDIASGLNIPFGELSEIYGKIQVQGRLYQEDINQLTGRGIPIIGELAKQFGVTEGEIKKMVESGKVGFPEIEKAFQNLTGEGGKFQGMMEKQSQTLNGVLSTLRDNLKMTLVEIIGINKEGEIATGSLIERSKEMVSSITQATEENKENIQTFGKVVIFTLTQIGRFIKEAVITPLFMIGGAIGWVGAQFAIFGPKILNFFKNLYVSIKQGWSDVFLSIKMRFKEFGDNLGKDAKEWGGNLLKMLTLGMFQKVGDFAKSVANVAKTISDYLGFHSPTEKGPNSDSDKWIPNLIKMMTTGFSNGEVEIATATSRVAGVMQKNLTHFNLDILKEEMDSLRNSAISMADSIMSDLTSQKSNVVGLVDEYKKLKQQIVDIDNAIKQTKQEGTEDIATRAVKVQDELLKINEQINTENEKRTQKELDELNLKKQKLEEELKLAQTQVNEIDIKNAKIELEKSETQRIIDRIAIKVAEQEAEKQRVIELRDAKKQAIDEEYAKYKELVDAKRELDKQYFELFGANIKKQSESIDAVINKIRTLNEMRASQQNEVSGARALGGTVSAGKTYLVGEKGPELFTPSTMGSIATNKSIGGGGGITINMGGVTVSNEADENRLVEKIQKTLTRQMQLGKLGIL